MNNTGGVRVIGLQRTEYTVMVGGARKLYQEHQDLSARRETLLDEQQKLEERQALLLHVMKQQNDEKLAEARKQQNELCAQLGQSLIESGQAKIKSGQAKIEYGRQLREEAAREKAEAAREKAEAARERAQAQHGLLVNALGLMIFTKVGSASKAKEIAEESLKQFEQLYPYPSNLFVIVTGKCMTLTPTVAQVILDVLKKTACTEPNLTKFQDEIVPEALRTVLSDRNITKVTFTRSAQETLAIKTAQEIARKRNLEISFV